MADTKGLQEKAYIYQTIGSGLASLWVQKNVSIANVQGADMLRIALPEAIGLQFVNEILGKDAMELLIQKKQDKYGKDKNNEPNREQPLIYADGIDYLEANKGAIHLYKLITLIGKQQFFETLKVHINKKQPIVFKDLYFDVLKKAPNDKKKEIKDGFEEVL